MTYVAFCCRCKLIFFSLFHSRRAVTFRRLLAEAQQDMESLTKIWTDSKCEGIVEMVNKIEGLKDDEKEELIKILDSHFDPEKKPIKPVVQRSERRGERRDSNNPNQMNNQGNNQGNNNNNNQNNMRNQRSRRAPRRRSPNKENQGPRNDSHRRKQSTKGFNQGNNNNNNNVMDPKTGAIRKDQHQQVDGNQNVMVSAN